jgi:hypothetical protein
LPRDPTTTRRPEERYIAQGRILLRGRLATALDGICFYILLSGISFGLYAVCANCTVLSIVRQLLLEGSPTFIFHLDTFVMAFFEECFLRYSSECNKRVLHLYICVLLSIQVLTTCRRAEKAISVWPFILRTLLKKQLWQYLHIKTQNSAVKSVRHMMQSNLQVCSRIPAVMGSPPGAFLSAGKYPGTSLRDLYQTCAA